MRKAADAFRSIGEVSRLVGVPPHVLRYWETQFPQLAPVKRADGRRYYRPEDLHLAAGLCELLREEGMTTKGAARMIARDKGAALRARGLARLPDRFGGEAEALAAETAGVEGSTEGMMTETMASPGQADGAKEGPVADAAPPGHRDSGPVPGVAVAGDALEPEPIMPDAAAVESPPTAAPAAAPMATAPRAKAPEVAAAGVEAPAAIPPSNTAPAAGEAAARRPVPSAGDLPLFPGLAPAAPPPGVWLPRLAGTAAALRAMTPPRRPPVQMQHLRDRLAALIDLDA